METKQEENSENDSKEDRRENGDLTVWSSVTHHQVSWLPLEVTDYLLSCGHLEEGRNEYE